MKTAKITFENYGKKSSVEFDYSDVDVSELLDAVVAMLYGWGFHKETVDNAIIELAEELNN